MNCLKWGEGLQKKMYLLKEGKTLGRVLKGYIFNRLQMPKKTESTAAPHRGRTGKNGGEWPAIPIACLVLAKK